MYRKLWEFSLVWRMLGIKILLTPSAVKEIFLSSRKLLSSFSPRKIKKKVMKSLNANPILSENFVIRVCCCWVPFWGQGCYWSHYCEFRNFIGKYRCWLGALIKLFQLFFCFPLFVHLELGSVIFGPSGVCVLHIRGNYFGFNLFCLWGQQL